MSDAIELTAREIAEAGTHTHVAGTTVGKPIDECAVCGWDIRCHNGVGVTLADRIADALRSLPAVPPAAAERLARAAVRREAASAALAFEKPETQVEWNDALAEFREAMEAYRAAPPAAEPAIFQKPGSSCDEGAVRGNNQEPAKEPAAQPFRHGRCCAEEPKEPAPCGTCGTIGGGGVLPDMDNLPVVGIRHKPCPSCRPGGAACPVHGLPLPCRARECGGAA